MWNAKFDFLRLLVQPAPFYWYLDQNAPLVVRVSASVLVDLESNSCPSPTKTLVIGIVAFLPGAWSSEELRQHPLPVLFSVGGGERNFWRYKRRFCPNFPKSARKTFTRKTFYKFSVAVATFCFLYRVSMDLKIDNNPTKQVC